MDIDTFNKFADYMDSMYGEGNWSTTMPDYAKPWPTEFDFLQEFLGQKLSISPELWQRLGMEL
jgi:hypothetical protein